MKRRTAVIVVALAAAGAMLAWPASPTWRAAVPAGDLLGVTADGTVCRAEPLPDGEGVALVGHAADTGRERSRVPLRVGLSGGGWSTAMSPDGRRAVVSRSRPTPDIPAAWRLFDATAGTPITPAVPMPAATVVWNAFAADGRHFTVSRWTPHVTGIWTHELFAADGRTVRTFGPLAGGGRSAFGFRGDGGAFAVIWIPIDDTPRWRVEVITLPCGDVRQFPLPSVGDWSIEGWRSNRMVVSVFESTAGPRWTRRFFAIGPDGNAVEDASLAAGSDLPVPWSLGPQGAGWQTRVFRVARSARVPYRQTEWVAERTGWSYAPGEGVDLRLRFVDDRGATLDELPTWLPADIAVSPAGDWVAALGDGRLERWPRRTWPRGAVAIIAAGLTLLIGGRGER